MSYPATSKDILSFLDTLHPINIGDLLQHNELKLDATPFIPTSMQKEVEIEEINHTVPMPRGFRNCKQYENCDKSDCGFLHEITWYKKDNHYLRIYNEHQKEIDHILKYRIRTFPKLMSTYDEQCKYHKKMMTLAKHYAEINCNDVSYLSLDLNYKKNRKNYKVEEHVPRNSTLEEYVPKNSKEEEAVVTSTSRHYPSLESLKNTTIFLHSGEQEPVQNTKRGVFRLNEHRNKNDYNSSWRN